MRVGSFNVHRLVLALVMALALLPSVASPALANQEPGATPVASDPVVALALPAITEATCDIGPAVTTPLSTDTVTYSDVTAVANGDATHTFTYTATVTGDGATLPDVLPDGYERTSDTLATYTITLPEADCEPATQAQRSESFGIMSGGSESSCVGGYVCITVDVSAPDTIAPGATLTYTVTLGRTSNTGSNDTFHLDLPGSNWTIGQNPGQACSVQNDSEMMCWLSVLSNGQPTSLTFTVSRTVTESCGSVITSDGGYIANTPVLFIDAFSTTVVCPASPQDPGIVGGSCVDGAFVEPTISLPATEGIAYGYSPDPLPRNGTVIVTATLDADHTWGNTTGWTVSGNTATRSFPVSSTECEPGMTVTKTVTAVNGQPATGPVAGLIPGDVVAYRIVVKNTGTANLAGLTVTDPSVTDLMCDTALPTGSAAPGSTVTCAATHTIDDTDLITGAFTNTATASGTYDGETVSDSASVTVTTVDADAVLTLEKSVDPVAIDTPGSVTYTFVIGNPGTLALDDVTLIDDRVDLAALDCDGEGLPVRLAAGASVTCSVPYDITQEMIDAGGPIVNDATVSAIASNQESVEATSSASLAVIQAPALTLEKTAATPDDETVTAGTVIAYEFTVTNGGNVTIDDIVVADALPGLVWDDANPDGAVGTLGPEETATLIATYTVTNEDVVAGVVTNQAQASGTRAGCAEVVTLRQEDGDRCGVASGVASVSVEVMAPPTPTATATPTETGTVTATPTETATATATATKTVAVKVLPATGHGGEESGTSLAIALLAIAALLGIAATVTSRRWRHAGR